MRSDADDVKQIFKDLTTSLIGLMVLIQTVYPHATGEAIIAAFQDGSWQAKAINLAFAYVLIRFKGGK